MQNEQEKQRLDLLGSVYSKESPHALDVRLMLNWYPDRIVCMSTGNSILELGIGHGYSSALLSNHFSRHVILEGSQQIIDTFRSTHATEPPVIINTLFEEYTTDEKFATIVMGFVLEHVDDPLAILKKYRKFLAKDGRLFVIVPNGATIPRRIGLAAGMIDSLTYLGDYDRELGHQRVFTLETFRDLIREAGLFELFMEGLLLKTATSEQLKTMNLPERVLQGMMQVGVEYPELCVAMMAVLHCV
jgi:SAM-dependent methyltransferase